MSPGLELAWVLLPTGYPDGSVPAMNLFASCTQFPVYCIAELVSSTKIRLPDNDVCEPTLISAKSTAVSARWPTEIVWDPSARVGD
jgi:hypothetical protein